MPNVESVQMMLEELLRKLRMDSRALSRKDVDHVLQATGWNEEPTFQDVAVARPPRCLREPKRR